MRLFGGLLRQIGGSKCGFLAALTVLQTEKTYGNGQNGRNCAFLDVPPLPIVLLATLVGPAGPCVQFWFFGARIGRYVRLHEGSPQEYRVENVLWAEFIG